MQIGFQRFSGKVIKIGFYKNLTFYDYKHLKKKFTFEYYFCKIDPKNFKICLKVFQVIMQIT